MASKEYVLDVEDGVGRVGRSLVLCGVTDQTLIISEGDVRRGDTVSCREKEALLALEDGLVSW